jgi:hypothetical protein
MGKSEWQGGRAVEAVTGAVWLPLPSDASHGVEDGSDTPSVTAFDGTATGS